MYAVLHAVAPWLNHALDSSCKVLELVDWLDLWLMGFALRILLVWCCGSTPNVGVVDLAMLWNELVWVFFTAADVGAEVQHAKADALLRSAICRNRASAQNTRSILANKSMQGLNVWLKQSRDECFLIFLQLGQPICLRLQGNAAASKEFCRC